MNRRTSKAAGASAASDGLAAARVDRPHADRGVVVVVQEVSGDDDFSRRFHVQKERRVSLEILEADDYWGHRSSLWVCTEHAVEAYRYNLC